ncbi:MAG: hypothetical protein C1943_00610 [Halochromatium sp.]|nr:hypothetical protein [Halochromatium sp.]
MKRILITGATGFLGRHFVTELLRDDPQSRVHALVRPKGQTSAQQRLAALELDPTRCHALAGDLSDSGSFAEQLPVIDEFWHLAGLTEFHEDKRAQLERVNIEGTRQALKLAKQLDVQRFFHISTAYVCGLTSAPVPEDGLLPSPRFRNPYEETKYLGERLVRESSLPWVVLRPSIIMGHSRTGAVESDKMVYGAVKACHLVMRLPGRLQPVIRLRRRAPRYPA